MKFAFIDAEKATWPVDVMCDVLGVSRSGFYAWKARPISDHATKDVTNQPRRDDGADGGPHSLS